MASELSQSFQTGLHIDGSISEVTETDTNMDSIASTSRTQSRAVVSSIHKHCHKLSDDERLKIKALKSKAFYWCAYCPYGNKSSQYPSTRGLAGHLKRQHNITWIANDNELRTSVKDIAENTLEGIYSRLIQEGELNGLEGEVLRRSVQRDAIRKALVQLIVVRRLPFQCVEWPEFHTFVQSLNREAYNETHIPRAHSTIQTWIHNHFLEAKDIVRKV